MLLPSLGSDHPLFGDNRPSPPSPLHGFDTTDARYAVAARDLDDTPLPVLDRGDAIEDLA